MNSSIGITAFKFDLIMIGFLNLLAGSKTSTSSTTSVYSPSLFSPSPSVWFSYSFSSLGSALSSLKILSLFSCISLDS